MAPVARFGGTALIGVVAATAPAGAQNVSQWNQALVFAGQQLQSTAAQIPAAESPEGTQTNGTWSLVANTAPIAWTQGFFPGSLWYLYEQTGDASWKTLATQWTTPLSVQETNTATQDLGFKMFPSFGHGSELTSDPTMKAAALAAAASLATRYVANPGIITVGTWNPAWTEPTVIDAMMDIELLEWASQNGGDRAWGDMAISHANNSIKNLIRADGSTYQVADYLPATGALRWQGTYQGYSNSSTWARGQTWAMYGFARMYAYTQQPQFLAAARTTTAWYLAHLPADRVPPWDFNSPTPTKDSSAAAVSAAALLELASVETDQTAAANDRTMAESILDELSGPAYLAQGSSSQGVLLHGVGDFPSGEFIDASLAYGDYYFIEALLRAEQLSKGTPLVTDQVKPLQPSSPDGGLGGQGSGGTTQPDAGLTTQPGGGVATQPDAGVASEPDGGTTQPEAGAPSESDAGPAGIADAGVASPSTDAHATASVGGGGCDAAGWSGAQATWLAGLVAAVVRRRRRPSG